ncbi:hypothetical protein TU86_03985 [Pseudomonas weihenstephanensis]|uniref:Uncharacterized protein n=1 Tax=Pseudomonas weihenstephanensis TaxID=1608994 RepID=A0A0J6IUE9_9PSED|nr:hypothetical protein TU86_03985 [Pseudomonas weihenstephanensis]KMN20015.1 hypothetical protein TU87_00010 [Pseudomonas weihenstephanensis]GLX88308.1 hypothetical protein Pfra02_08770 [Pseudomonas fragi]
MLRGCVIKASVQCFTSLPKARPGLMGSGAWMWAWIIAHWAISVGIHTALAARVIALNPGVN